MSRQRERDEAFFTERAARRARARATMTKAERAAARERRRAAAAERAARGAGAPPKTAPPGSMLVPFAGLGALGIPYTRTGLNEMIARGRFPPPVRVGVRAVAWVRAELDAWVERLMTERDTRSESR